jgi:hypothetical protein
MWLCGASCGVMMVLARPMMALLVCLMLLPQQTSAAAVAGPEQQWGWREVEGTEQAQIVRRNIMQQLVPANPIPHVDAEVAAIAPALLPSGTWADIDYADGSRSWWFAAEHLRRCLLLASALSSPHSQHHAAPAVRAVADRAFEWWLATDPQNQWWWMQIGVPRILCKYLLMLPSPRLYELAAPLLARTPLSILMHWTGCNRVWVASIHVLRGAIELNATRLTRVRGSTPPPLPLISSVGHWRDYLCGACAKTLRGVGCYGRPTRSRTRRCTSTPRPATGYRATAPSTSTVLSSTLAGVTAASLPPTCSCSKATHRARTGRSQTRSSSCA